MRRAVTPTVAALVVLAAPAAAEPEPPVTDPDEEVIVVTGSRHETPLSDAVVATEVITRAEIAESGATTLAELLANHPGVEITPSFRGSEIRMQGLDPEYVLLLVDGNRTIGRIGGAVDLDRYAVEDIERIEIVKGPSSALYGSDALAGVINIITREPERPIEGELSARYGQGDEIDASARIGARRRRWSATFGLGLHRGDGYDLSPETPNTTASAYSELRGHGRGVWKPGGGLELSLAVQLLRRDLDGVDQSATGALFDRRSITEEGSASVRLRFTDPDRPSDRLTATVHASQFRDQLLQDQRGAGDLDTFEKTREGLARLETTYTRLVADHLLGGGLELSGELLDADRLSDPGSRYRLSAFAQDEWLALDELPLILSPGLRIDADSQFGTHVSPKLAARWDPAPAVTARAGVGRGFRAPDFRELLLLFENPGVGYVVEGNPELEPETSTGVNGGVELRPARGLSLSVNGFYNRITNLIIIDLIDEGGQGEPQRFSYSNVASARTAGVESLVAIRRELGAIPGSLRGELGYTFTDTRDNDAGRALPGRSRHRITAAATLAFSRVRTTVRGALYGTRRFFADTDGDGVEDTRSVDPYATVDVRLAATVWRELGAYAGITNLLDAGDIELMPLPPRRFYAGLTARY